MTDVVDERLGRKRHRRRERLLRALRFHVARRALLEERIASLMRELDSLEEEALS